MSDILEKIIAVKREEVAAARKKTPLTAMRAYRQPESRCAFALALARVHHDESTALALRAGCIAGSRRGDDFHEWPRSTQ